ncbi:MAG: hypothetical protein IKX14_08765 [Neisseriaceae bacterium]|nr:hypothetical protein [Neisseriaceae bacterium]
MLWENRRVGRLPTVTAEHNIMAEYCFRQPEKPRGQQVAHPTPKKFGVLQGVLKAKPH